MDSNPPVPPFEPHPLVRGPHAQTIAGRYLPGRRFKLHSKLESLLLTDGDRLTWLESAPPGWSNGRPIALLVHGLGGCARAAYVARVADRLHRMGVRTVRMNLRGAGDGRALARGIYHSGRTEDPRAVANLLHRRHPDSPLALIGFSLGANLVLKLAAEAAAEPLPGLDCVLAANPPLDLAACCDAIRRPRNRLYDRNFVRGLKRDVARLHRLFPELGPLRLDHVRSVYDFDDAYTAPRNGFKNADDYYAQCSAGPLLHQITLPGLIVHADDDPFIPVETVARVALPPRLHCEIASGGGHLGYLHRARIGLDHRWLDARLSDWLARRWNLRSSPAPASATATVIEHDHPACSPPKPASAGLPGG